MASTSTLFQASNERRTTSTFSCDIARAVSRGSTCSLAHAGGRSRLSTSVPYFLVAIEGDAARAAGLLAVAGIQNLVHTAEAPPTAIARLIADDGKQAVQRVSL